MVTRWESLENRDFRQLIRMHGMQAIAPTLPVNTATLFEVPAHSIDRLIRRYRWQIGN
jgi:hypothetical protein